MGKTGVAPTPLPIRIRAGNPHNRPLPGDLAEFPPTSATPNWWDVSWDKNQIPREDFLKALSTKIYKELGEQLAQLGLLTTVDVDEFGKYCHMLAQWVLLKQFIDQNGQVYPVYRYFKNREEITENGKTTVKTTTQKEQTGLRVFPQFTLYKQIGETLTRMSKNFGLAPALRLRLVVPSSGGFFSTGEDDEFID